MVFEFATELTATAEALAGAENRAHIRRAPGERIEHGKLRAAEAAREAGTRQAQHRAYGARPDARQTGAGFFRPAQGREWQGRQLSNELRCIHDNERLAGTRRGERRERRGCERQHRLCLKSQALAPQLPAQARHARKQLQAPLSTSSSSPSGGTRLTRGVNRCTRLASCSSFFAESNPGSMHAGPQLPVMRTSRRWARTTAAAAARLLI